MYICHRGRDDAVFPYVRDTPYIRVQLGSYRGPHSVGNQRETPSRRRGERIGGLLKRPRICLQLLSSVIDRQIHGVTRVQLFLR